MAGNGFQVEEPQFPQHLGDLRIIPPVKVPSGKRHTDFPLSVVCNEDRGIRREGISRIKMGIGPDPDIFHLVEITAAVAVDVLQGYGTDLFKPVLSQKGENRIQVFAGQLPVTVCNFQGTPVDQVSAEKPLQQGRSLL